MKIHDLRSTHRVLYRLAKNTALHEVARIGICVSAKVYIETTIPSYLVARPSRDLLIAAHQRLTRDWWDLRRTAFDLYVSEPVLEESAAGDATFARKRIESLADVPVLAVCSRKHKPRSTSIWCMASSTKRSSSAERRWLGD